jgi:hypothetical protein
METAPSPVGGRPEAFWPTESQALLLRAALLRGPAALEAWREWKTQNDLIESHLDLGSFRLLPLVYKNMIANGATDPLMTRLKGVYRYSWCANQQLFHESTAVLDALHHAGIRTMVLKGAAFSTLYYRDQGARPMSDVDVLVPLPQARQAVACLARLGWRATSPSLAEDLRFRHAVQLVNDGGREFDLHWHAFYECLQPHADDDLWRRAVPTEILHVRTHTLDPTDTLLHTIVHGIQWDEVPTIRWIADSMMILGTAGARIDWDRLLDQARRRRVLLRSGKGLRYLRDEFQAPIPAEVIAHLDASRPSYVERLEYRYLALGPEEQGRVVLGYYPYVMVGYLRFAASRSLFRKIAELPDYMCYRFGLERRAELLPMVLRHAVRKTRKVLVPRPATSGRP